MANDLTSLELIEEIENRNQKKVKVRREYYNDLSAYEFSKRFRLCRTSVLQLLDLIEEKIATKTHLNNAVSPLEQLLVALRFYATGGYQTSVGDFNDVSQATACRIIARVTEAIASLRPKFINMPETDEECREVSEEFFKIGYFPGVIGAVDCTHVEIISPGGIDAERFRNRKGRFSINVQTVVSADLSVQHVVARWPGSVHDSTILSNSTLPDLMASPMFRKYHLLGDSGYPCQSYILTPLTQPNSAAEIRYNTAHIKTRNTVERSYGILKNRFPCLAMKLRNAVQNVPAIIVACCVLHNLALRLGDPEPPLDEEVRYILENYDQGPAPFDGNTAGFARRRLVIQQFFT